MTHNGSWILWVRVYVDNTPDRIQQGYQKLEKLRDMLEGIYEFKVFDRRVHDTRNNEMPLQALG